MLTKLWMKPKSEWMTFILSQHNVEGLDLSPVITLKVDLIKKFSPGLS